MERLNSELLRQVVALEHGQENLILIPDSPEPIPVPPPGGLSPGSVLVEIDNGVDDEQAQVIREDQAEGVVRRQVTIEEGGVFGVVGEFYKEGEDIMDVLRRVEADEAKVPRYQPPPTYDDNYVLDHQV